MADARRKVDENLLGTGDTPAAEPFGELRDLLEAWRDAHRTSWQTVVKVATTGILAALIIKLKQP